MTKPLQGRGKGGGGGAARTPVEAADTLRSTMLARVTDLIGEGECEGLVSSSGVVLQDAVMYGSPVVSGGVITPQTYTNSDPENPWFFPGAGYPDGAFAFYTIADTTGSGAMGQITCGGGQVTAVTILQGGSNYSAAPIVTLPQIMGQALLLNGTPLQNADLTYNFDSSVLDFRSGTAGQTVMPGFQDTRQVLYADAITLRHSQDVILTVSAPNLDRVVFGIAVTSLYQVNTSSGDTVGTSVAYQIFLVRPGYPDSLLVSNTLTGKVSTEYVRTHEVIFRPFQQIAPNTSSWTFRFVRTTADSTSQFLHNGTQVNFIIGVTEAALTYPHSCLAALQVDARQFASIPNRAYRMRLLKVRVPSNYFPASRKYTRNAAGVDTGVEQPWDGTFQTEAVWTDNAAWCFYDLITNTRYGPGQDIPAALVDKWNIYKLGRYCDELVPSGGLDDEGNVIYEPRFRCNTYIQTRGEAITLIRDMASIFAGMLYWRSGLIQIVSDLPDASRMAFTTSNVGAGEFAYTGVANRARHNVAVVRWNDPADQYRVAYEYVDPVPEDVALRGVRQLDLTAFGCTSRGQAHRYGRRMLFQEMYLTETVSFRAALEGARVYPGMVFSVADNFRSGLQYSGRVSSIGADRHNLTLDRLVDLNQESASNPTSDEGHTPVPRINQTNQTISFRLTADGSDQLIKFDTLADSFYRIERSASAGFSNVVVLGDDIRGLAGEMIWRDVGMFGFFYRVYRVGFLDYTVPGAPQLPPGLWNLTLVIPVVSTAMGDIQSFPVPGGGAEPQQQVNPSRLLTFNGVTVSTGYEGNLSITLPYNATLPAQVEPGAIWMLSSANIQPQLFKCLSATEEAEGVYAISGLKYIPDLNDLIELGLELDTADFSIYSNAAVNTNLPPTNFTASFTLIQAGSVSSYHIDLAWTPPRWSNVTEYEIHLRKGQAGYIELLRTASTLAETSVESPDTYTFRLRAIYLDGSVSRWIYDTAIVVDPGSATGTDFPERVTGLELLGQGNVNTFVGRDIILDWRINSASNSYELGSEPSGGNSGGNSADFAFYELRFYNPDLYENAATGRLRELRRVTTQNSNYAFRWDENRATFQGPHRDLLVVVTAKDYRNNSSPAQELLITNAYPLLPEGVTHSGTQTGPRAFTLNGTSLEITFPPGREADHAGYRVWLIIGEDVDVTTHIPTFEGNVLNVSLPVVAGNIYYLRYTAFDSFSAASEYLNWTGSELSALISAQEVFTVV